ncbi:MAG TPA: hypothetical protein DCY42_13320 [Chloroflexi bacterium]|nr:hypothetical protein [Chloroflexota bacterium]
MPVLDIPYVSQLEDGARKYNNDCGAASGVMLVRAYKGDQTLTVDQYYKKTGQNTDQYLSASQVMNVLRDYDIPSTWRIGVTESDVRLLVDQKRPMIVLYNYKIIRENGISTEIPFSGFHFAVLVGIDDFFVYLNDPLWTNEKGKNLQIPLDTWMDAWTKFPVNNQGVPANPSRGAIIPEFPLDEVVVDEGQIYLKEAKRMRVIFPGGMNVRLGPGTEFSPVDSRNNGDVLMILETKADGADVWGCLGPNRWIAIQFNGNTYLVPDFPGGTNDPAIHEIYEVVGPDGLNVRSGSGISYPIVDALLTGQKIKVYATKQDAADVWGRIGIGQWIAIKFQGVELAKLSE